LKNKELRSFFVSIFESYIFTLKGVFCTKMYQKCTKNVPRYSRPPMLSAILFLAESMSIAC
jgi:hypothetical protein